MKIWIDDVREAPEGWIWCKTAPEAIYCYLENIDQVTEMSFDHDLGDDDEGTGYSVLCVVEREVVIRGKKPPVLHIHTANPSARIKMALAVSKIQRAFVIMEELGDSYDE